MRVAVATRKPRRDAEPLARRVRIVLPARDRGIAPFRRRWCANDSQSASIVLYVVPLVTLVFGAVHLYDAREFTEHLLTQPVNRRGRFGLYGGLAIPLVLAMAVGVGAHSWCTSSTNLSSRSRRAERRSCNDTHEDHFHE